MRIVRYPLILSLLLLPLWVYAASEIQPFRDESEALRFTQLTQELRCMVCQNESLDSSQSKLAVDMRQRIYELILQEQTDDQIKQNLVERFGDAILFKPPVNRRTGLLWFLPFIFLTLASATVLRLYRSSEQ